ncbi:MAG: AAC(3) family N-acetyltransferase [Lachnospiraceae bacterium]
MKKIFFERLAGVAMQIESDLRQLRIAPTDSLLVHTSFKSLGEMHDGITGLISALENTVCDGTLLMPALSYATVDAGHPFFDANTTPSCTGVVPEVFRTLPKVQRSINPTHSVSARGVEASWFTSDHQIDDTPVGPHSPLAKLRDREGKILLLGCGLEPNTSMHGVEELTEPPYLFLPSPVTYTCTNAMGLTIKIECRRHNFSAGEGYYYRQRYDRITEVLNARYIRRGRVGQAVCFVLEAAPLWEAAEKILQQDPFYFVERAELPKGE